MDYIAFLRVCQAMFPVPNRPKNFFKIFFNFLLTFFLCYSIVCIVLGEHKTNCSKEEHAIVA